eukprot:scaffold568596_cov25-Prasinocladus_malaysianus.AAC.1
MFCFPQLINLALSTTSVRLSVLRSDEARDEATSDYICEYSYSYLGLGAIYCSCGQVGHGQRMVDNSSVTITAHRLHTVATSVASRYLVPRQDVEVAQCRMMHFDFAC